MAEKVKLITLDIDIDRLTKNTSATLRSVEDLSAKQRDLKKTMKELNSEISNNSKAAKAALKANDTKKYEELKKAQTQLKKTYVESSQELVNVQTHLKAMRKQYNLGTKMIDAYTQKEHKHITMIKQTDGSIDQLSAALEKNKKTYKSLTKEERENTKIGGKLLELIQKHDKEYKELHNSIGNTSVNVGNYRQEMKQAIMDTGAFGRVKGQLFSVIGPFLPLLKRYGKQWNSVIKKYRTAGKVSGDYTKTQKAVAIANNLVSASLKLLKVALISTGIGAIVVLLGSLIAYFSKSQKGIDKFSQALAGVKAVVNVFVDRLIKMGSALVKLFSFDFSGFKQDATDAFKGIGDEIENDFNQAIKLEKQLQRLEKAEILLDIQRSASKSKMKELNKIAEDTTKSTKERINALEEMSKIETVLAEKQQSIAKERLSNAIGEIELTEKGSETLERFKNGAISADEAIGSLGISESNLNDLKEFRDLFNELESRNAELSEISTTRQNKENTIRKEAHSKAIAAAQKRVDAELKASKTKLDIYIAENKDKAKTLKEQLDFEQSVHDKKVSLLKEELKNKKKTREEYDLEILNLSKDLAQQQAELTSEHASKELDIYIAQNKSKIDSETRLTDELVDEEEDRLTKIYDKRVALLKQQRADELISQQEYTLQKLQLDAEYLEQKTNLDNSVKEQKEEERQLQIEADQINWENEMETRALRGESEFTLRQSELERNKKAEISAAKKTKADIAKIEKKYNTYSKQLEAELTEFKAQQRAIIFSGLKSLFGESSKLGKLFAIAEIVNNTVMNASKAFAQAAVFASNPLTAPLAANAYVQGGIIVATGAAQAAKTVIPKMEKGGAIKIGGKRHSAGGTKFYGEDGTTFEAERDEILVVLNRAASHMFAGLSEFNEQHGGNAFVQPGRYLAAGGLVARGGVTNVTNTNNNAPVIDYDLLASKIIEGVRQLPHPVTLVQDIISETQAHNKIIDRATF